MTLTTPGLLFPAISLLLLAYTNRFLVLAQLIRQLCSNIEDHRSEVVMKQIKSLKKRISLIKSMQIYGILSFLLCTIAMFALFIDYEMPGKVFFGLSIISLSISLILSLWEIIISTNALNLELEGLEKKK